MVVKACGASYKGNIRGHNEDNIYLDGEYRKNLSEDVSLIESERESDAHIFAVFDGLGGESYGENASLIAAQLLKQYEEAYGGSSINIDEYLAKTDKTIRNQSAELGVRTMGTTVAMATIHNEDAIIYNIGDSRVYLSRGGDLVQLSKDHSVVQSMIDLGFVKEEDRYTNRHVGELTQYLGMSSEEDVEPSADRTQLKLENEDILILCSDGLNSELGDQTIKESLNRSREIEPRFIATDLIMSAKEGKCADNVSVIIVKCQ